MKKYLYLIKNSKIPTYLKYWLMYSSKKISLLIQSLPITLENTIKDLKIVINKIYGNSEQESTTGKNLLPTFGSASNQGVNVVSKDYEITINGTSTGEATPTSTNRFTLQAGTYKFCEKYVSGLINGTVMLIIRAVGGTTNLVTRSFQTTNYTNNYSQIFTLSEETELYYYIYVGSSDRTYTNFKFDCQVVNDSTDDFDFEKYTRSEKLHLTQTIHKK